MVAMKVVWLDETMAVLTDGTTVAPLVGVTDEKRAD